MLVDAIVLAGAKNDGKLHSEAAVDYEAAIDIGGRVMVDYVLSALRECTDIGRIMMVGPAALGEMITTAGVEMAEAGGSMIENIRIGIDSLQPTRKVLLVTSDIPLITKVGIQDFLQRCEAVSADLYYPVVAREINERMYPGVHRTYVHVTEGVFTGGNMVLMEPAVVRQGHELIEKAIEMRKKPWKLAQLMGPYFLCKLLVNKLSIKEIEKRVSVVLGFRGIGVISPFPEVGIDVDKPSDLILARKALAPK